MNNSSISAIITEKAPLILAEVQKAKSILLHCHPSPDPDSVGSALAMKLALEQMGKKATVIRGDSEIPQAFMHFPGATDIVMKDFFEIDQNAFDLFLVQDSSSIDRISALQPVIFPESMKVINIDHHPTNTNFGSINLVEPAYPSTTQVLFDLFSIWNVTIDEDIAKNIFIGIYTDTGAFKYRGTTAHTFEVVSKLTPIISDISKLVSTMEDSNTPAFMSFLGLALNSIETFLNGKLAIACVPHASMVEKGIPETEASAGAISPFLRSVIGWDIDVALIEVEPGKVKGSTRTRDQDTYDVSKLALALGGGGHKAAAGFTLNMSIDQAKKLVVSKAKELYNL